MQFSRLNPASALSFLAGAFGLLSSACTTSPPCDSGSNNKLDSAGMCACLIGHEWCEDGGEDSLNCCEVEDDVNLIANETASSNPPQDDCSSGSNNYFDGDDCRCDDGFEFCTNDDDDLECCEIGDNTSFDTQTSTSSDTSTSGDTTGADKTGVLYPDPDCLPEENQSHWCTHDVSVAPEGSEIFECIDGLWTKDDVYCTEYCIGDGFDFAFGCADDPTADVRFTCICGSGPGDDCTTGTYGNSCDDINSLIACIDGKTQSQSCQETCEGTSDEQGFFYELGECGDVVDEDGNEDIGCFCYNEDDEPGDSSVTSTTTG